MNPLQRFHGDKPMFEAVKSFIEGTLREMAADKAFAGEDVSGIKDANDCLIKSFDKLQELYGKMKQEDIPNPR